MRIVSYTRTTSCFPGEEIPANVITAQNERIRKYVEKHGWKIAGKYSDRKKDQSENTSFERLLQDGVQRKFDAVIVDSIFRAGKDLWSAREVLLQTFHFAGIWFIVVEDDFISVGKSNEEAEAYFNQKYSVMRKENIRYRVNQRNRNGILSWNDVKYGYRLTEDFQLAVDEDTAPVVKRMFELCAGGMTPKEIAALFTKEEIPIPLVSRGMNVKIDHPYQWNRLKVRRLLDKTVYIGHWSKVVQGEVMNFTNEPIVEEDVFQKVQDYLASIATHAKPPRQKHPYTGLVCDKDFGFCLRLRKTRSGVLYFAFASVPPHYEGNTQLLLSDLETQLRSAMSREKEKAERIVVRIREEGTEKKRDILSQMQDAFKNSAKMLAERQKSRMETYRSYSLGKISELDMKKEEERYQNTVSSLENIFQEYFTRRERIETAINENNPWLQLFLTWDPAQILDRETLLKYISRITLDHMQIATIEFTHTEWYMELPDDWRK